MNKLYVLLMFVALVAYVACQRQQMEEQAQEQQQVTQDEANTREKAPEMISTPASSASPSTSPEKRYDLKSQAQKFHRAGSCPCPRRSERRLRQRRHLRNHQPIS